MEAKDGKRTTEWAAMIAVQLIMWLNAALPEGSAPVEITDQLTASLSAALVAVYTIVRGWVKSQQPVVVVNGGSEESPDA